MPYLFPYYHGVISLDGAAALSEKLTPRRVRTCEVRPAATRLRKCSIGDGSARPAAGSNGRGAARGAFRGPSS